MEKIVSTTTTPPMRRPNWLPMTVMMGMRAFASAWPKMTLRSGRPLLHAVVI